MLPYLLILILFIAVVYLYTKVRKLEKNQLQATETNDGEVIITFKGIDIYKSKL